jgi:hypothetical protein
MENENTIFPFLNSDLAKKYFADTDYALKQGRHIQDYRNDHKIFVFIDEYFDKGLQAYYEIFFWDEIRERRSRPREILLFEFPRIQ